MLIFCFRLHKFLMMSYVDVHSANIQIDPVVCEINYSYLTL
jgi:hypothetical protein